MRFPLAMLDSALRPVKDAALGPIVSGPLARVHPTALSVLGLLSSVGAAAAAWRGSVALAISLWLIGRVLDGLDGAVARSTGRQSDLGGLLDFLFDTVGYALIPLGIAAGVDDRVTWIATAVVLGSFYLNAVSLGHVAAVLEKRGTAAPPHARITSTVLPRGLVEGTETIVFFTLALAFPAIAWTVWMVMAIAVVVTVIERTRWIAGQLTSLEGVVR